ncbi:MAG: peptidase S8 [Herpetosiphonaceae bacterium]|nr:peptidase S8 [Herpetosiphonaceae bacterium]
MRRRQALSLLLVLLVSLAAHGQPTAHAAQPAARQNSALHRSATGFVPGQLIVGLQSDSVLAAQSAVAPVTMLHNRWGNLQITAAAALGQNSYQLDLPSQADIPALVEMIKRDPAVRFAEPNYRYDVLRTPNDPLFGFQYLPDRINLRHGWDVTTGSPGVIVAVIDTGVNPDHPDLQNKLVAGYNYVEGNDQPFDDVFHGTFVSGIIAAPGDNGVGVAGLCWQCRIMPIRALGRQGGTAGSLAQSIRFAVDNGARIINMSLGGAYDSTLLHDAVNYALSKNVLVVAAAGNSGDTDNAPSYPGIYPGVLEVGATDAADHLASFSTRNGNVGLTAPGVNIASIANDQDLLAYGAYSGTSFSSAVVSGVAALVLSVNPSLSADQVKQLLLSTPQDLGTLGRDDGYGAGRVDAGRAVDAAYPQSFAPVADPKAADATFFAATGHTLHGDFKTYWSTNGGLPIFGYPISEEFDETTPDGTFRVQYFERQRFELHPNPGAAATVLGGRLGELGLLRTGRDWQRLPPGDPSDPDCRFFATTGHTLCGPFRVFWEAHGLHVPGLSAEARSLQLWGLPLTEAQEEVNAAGDNVITQWFERARFEYHSLPGGTDRVLLGLLGDELARPALPGPSPTPQPGPNLDRCANIPAAQDVVIAPANCVLFGTTLELQITGFQPGEKITVQFVNEQGKVADQPKGSTTELTAATDGSASVAVDTSALTPGLWSAVFHGTSSGHQATIFVRIVDG